jgi:hypothetical protein
MTQPKKNEEDKQFSSARAAILAKSFRNRLCRVSRPWAALLLPGMSSGDPAVVLSVLLCQGNRGGDNGVVPPMFVIVIQ